MAFYDDVHKVSKLMKGYKPDTGSKEKDEKHREWMKKSYPGIAARSKALEKKKESSKSFYKRINTLPYEDRNVEFHKREHGAKFDMEKYKKSAKEQEGAIKESKARFS
jgi:hypothetical protein